MDNNIFLLSMPGGSEWIIILLLGLLLIISPILAIVYYSRAKNLKKENKELLEKLLNKN
jgi:uncharacterized membrane protein HdeD (DUF308 family)